jgi:hypothetical protein
VLWCGVQGGQAEDHATLEPMLFNLPTLLVMHRILDDRRIIADATFAPLISFTKCVPRTLI